MAEYIGKTLGGYQIVEQIGQGGMATVFKAYQPSMDRYVAIKILPGHFTEDETFVARFNQEARTLARLEHPHILPVHDYGEQEGITYLVMRFVEAGTLKDVIAREGPLGLQEAARILEQVGRALDYAHSQGVLHRDIKPSNVLVDARGDTFLTDFGIAKLVAETARFTVSGAIIGTPAYMAPEQGLGQPTDHRCDIYALGVVLYELVTGRVPYEAETPLAVVLKHINDPLPLPRQIRPDLPGAVERVILKAMAKASSDRFQTAQEMLDALLGALADGPPAVAAPQPPAPSPEETVVPLRTISPQPPAVPAAPLRDRVGTTPRRIPWLPIGAAAGVLAVVLVVVLLVLPNLGSGEETAGETPTLPAVAAASTAEPTQAAATDSAPPPVAQPSAAVGDEPSPLAPVAPTSGAGAASPGQPGWTYYSNGDFLTAVARQDGYLWAGGEGGLIRWSLSDGDFVKLGVADGLASNQVNDLLVDDDDLLWVATDHGISRFDGQGWITIDEAVGLDESAINALYVDAEGGLWAGSDYGDRGLNYYDGTAWGPPPIPPLPFESASITVIAGDEYGDLAVGTAEQGLAVFDGEDWTLFTGDDLLPSNEVLAALWTDDGLWVGLDSDLVRLDPESGEPTLFPRPGIHAIHQDDTGELWFGGEEGVTRLDPETGDWQEFYAAPVPVGSVLVTDILGDDEGEWFSTYGHGVVRFDGSDWQSWSTGDTLGGNYIEAMVQDETGAVWVTHPGSGLSRYDPASDSWTSFGEANGVLDWPGEPAVDSEGHVWIGDYGELARWDGLGWVTFAPAELADHSIYAIAIGPDDVQWLVTDDGLVRHDPATDGWTTFSEADHPILRAIWSLLVDDNGTIWVGGEAGLIQYDGSGWQPPSATGAAPVDVDDIALGPDGSLWIAGGDQLYQLTQGQWYRRGGRPDGWLESVAVGPDGSVWVGYDGLAFFDPATDAWQDVSPAGRERKLWINDLFVTPEGVVWLGTDGGVFRYVPPDTGTIDNDDVRVDSGAAGASPAATAPQAPDGQPTPAPTAVASVSGRIIYSAGGVLHVVHAQTGQDIVPPIGGMFQADLRADGKLIIANGDGERANLWTLDAATGAFIRQQSGFTDDFRPFWAPDGAQFVYDSFHQGGQFKNALMLYKQTLDSGQDQHLVHNGVDILGRSPVWAQDDWIVFTGCAYDWGTDSGCGLYRMPSWGGEPALILVGALAMRATDNHAAQLLFMSQETGDWEVYVIPTTGGTARNLSNSSTSNDGLGTFSPDGRTVAFASDRGGGWAIWAVGVGGGSPAKLFDLPAAPADPTGDWTQERMSWGP